MNSLEKLGFSPSEKEVYLFLLKGTSYASEISSKTGINRTNVYEALDRLALKGVVSFVERNKVKWFEANSSDSLLSLVRERKEEVKNLQQDLIRDIAKFPEHKEKSLEASIFVGKKGLRMIFEEILQEKKSISLIAAELQFKELFGPYFELWHQLRIENKIKLRSIFPKKMKKQLKKRKFLEYKFIDNKFSNPTTTIIYGSTCLLIQWSKEPLAIKINDKSLAKSHQNYFDLLWES